MSRPAQTWRALAERLSRSVERLGPEDAGEVAGALEELAARARAVQVEGEVSEFVTSNPGVSSNCIAQCIHRDRSLLLRTLRVLERSGRLTFEPGPKGARLWSAKKDRFAAINRSA